jgi:DHA1 family tetracycline resistance protein-like MFS transporter
MHRFSPIAVLIFTVFIDLLGFGIIIPILPTFATELGASSFQTGLIAASFSVMNFLCAPWWGTMSDRVGRRPVMLISIGLTAAAYLLLGFSTTLTLLLASRLLAGIGSANIAVAQAYVTDVSAPEDRTRNLGLIGAAFGIGFVIGPLVGGFLKSHYGIFAVGAFAGALGFINLVLAYFTLPEPAAYRRLPSPKPPATEVTGTGINPFTAVLGVLRQPVISQLVWINFIFVAGFSMMAITSALLWRDKYGLDEKHIGFTFAFLGVATAVAQGALVRPLNRAFGERRLLLLGSAVMMGALLLMPLVPVEWFVPLELVSLAGIALANGAMTPSLSSLIAAHSPPSSVGRNLGSNQSFSARARAVGPVLGGALYGFDYHGPFFGGALIMVVCLGVSWALARRLGEAAAAPLTDP